MDTTNKKTITTKAKDKQTPAQQEVEKFELNIRKKKLNIDKKYMKSTVNKLYVFPRLLSLDISTSSSESQQEIGQSYNLKQQNQKSRKNQTKILQHFYQPVKIKQYNSVKSQNSMASIQQGGKTLKNRKSKSKNIQISFDTKKKTPSRNKVNSQRKLFAEQYSFDHRAYATTKEQGNNLVVSFRGNKKHQINISLSGRRMKTQIS